VTPPGPGELDPRRVERLHERAEDRLLREPVEFYQEGLGRFPQGAGPVEEGPPERPGVGVPPTAAELGPERFDQVGGQELGPGGPAEGGGAERRAVGVAPLGVAARHGVEVEIVHPDAVALLVVLALPEFLDELVGRGPLIVDVQDMPALLPGSPGPAGRRRRPLHGDDRPDAALTGAVPLERRASLGHAEALRGRAGEGARLAVRPKGPRRQSPPVAHPAGVARRPHEDGDPRRPPQQGRHRRVLLGRPGVHEEPEAGGAAPPPEPLGQLAGDLVELHGAGGAPQPKELAPADIKAGEELLHLHVLVPGGVVALRDGELPSPAGDGVLVQGDPDHPTPTGPAPGGGGAALEEPGDPGGGERPEPGPEAVPAPGPTAAGEPAQAGVLRRLQVEDAPEADQGQQEAVQQAPRGHLAAGGVRGASSQQRPARQAGQT
jgi:hypothetical protein